MPTLPEVLDAAGATREQFNHWHRTIKVLRTEYLPAEVGVPRPMTFDNGLELGFMAKLAKAGTAGNSSARIASEWIAKHKAGTLSRFYSFNDMGDELEHSKLLTFDDLAVTLSEDIPGGYADRRQQKHEFKPAAMITTIDRGEIVRRMEELFKQEG